MACERIQTAYLTKLNEPTLQHFKTHEFGIKFIKTKQTSTGKTTQHSLEEFCTTTPPLSQLKMASSLHTRTKKQLGVVELPNYNIPGRYQYQKLLGMKILFSFIMFMHPQQKKKGQHFFTTLPTKLPRRQPAHYHRWLQHNHQPTTWLPRQQKNQRNDWATQVARRTRSCWRLESTTPRQNRLHQPI